MINQGFFDQFPNDLQDEAHRRWPTGQPNFTCSGSEYFNLFGYAGILRAEMDSKEIDEYMKKNKGCTALARRLEALQEQNFSLRAELESLEAIREKIHELVKYVRCDRVEEDD